MIALRKNSRLYPILALKDGTILVFVGLASFYEWLTLSHEIFFNSNTYIAFTYLLFVRKWSGAG
jgi:hypothetical protein